MKNLHKFVPDGSVFKTQAPKTKKEQEEENDLRKKLALIAKSEDWKIDNS